MTVQEGPCSAWPVNWGSFDISTVSPAATGWAVSGATQVLWALSGRRFGTCSVTLRPCRAECYANAWPSSTYAYPWSIYGPMATAGWDASYWFPLGCGSCTNNCSCSVISEAYLPAPVNDVTLVKVDGSPLVTGAYRLDNNRILVRTDGTMWPRCNDLSKDDTQVGTWSVTADYGIPVPDMADLAVGELAAEILKATAGKECGLPTRVTSIVRQGVSVQFPPIAELLAEGRLGLFMCDLFLSTYNPNKLDLRGRVYSIDRPPVRRTGT